MTLQLTSTAALAASTQSSLDYMIIMQLAILIGSLNLEPETVKYVYSRDFPNPPSFGQVTWA